MRVDRTITVADLRLIARRRLPRAVFDFIDEAADDKIALRANMADFDAIKLKQRILAGVESTSLQRNILGVDSSAPLLVGPPGLANIAAR